MRNRGREGPNLNRRILLTAAGLAPMLAAGMARAAEPAPAADLARAVNAYDQATVGNDTAALAELIADDYVLVNSDASVQGKASYLADFNVPGFKIEPYVMAEPLLKVFGDTALTGGLLHLNWTQEGARRSRLLRIAHLWTRRDGRWRITYSQLTRLPE